MAAPASAFYDYLFATADRDDEARPYRPPRIDDHDAPATTDTLATTLRSNDDTAARAALETLFAATYPKLVRFALHYVSSQDSAEDVVGDVFSSLWTHRATLAPQGSLEAYLFGAVRRRAISTFRQWHRHARQTPPVLADGEYWGMGVPPSAPDADATEHDTNTVIWRAIADLPERQREILSLRWQAELGWDEIARVLESTSAAVQKQHSRAAITLRARLSSFLK